MNYLQEWGSSCVDDQLTRLNVIPLEGQSPYEYLLYSDALPRRNDGKVGTSQTRMRVYQVVAPDDGRVEVFKQWLTCDRQPPTSSECWRDFRSHLNTMAQSASHQVECVQLCLSF